eukprot:CAMPEP_0167756702 /NCGR_PEP_ID=MMETSP0110_2-20121227/9530_1 /TAXON_ID=629695 /ORGANISM="Gymnochlora sp., Strain CCMP2014" /LENGTH=119 /DNA_ID=CAMNT_0007642837 /DNA_START=35 /DNA_END=394 /DNA_ORIENTATION=+
MYTELSSEKREIKVSLKWILAAFIGVLAMGAFAWNLAQNGDLEAPMTSRMATSFSPCLSPAIRSGVSADATYVMWKGAKKKMMKRPRKKGYDSRRTPTVYPVVEKKPEEYIVVKAAKKD